MESEKRLIIVAGEASGDIHAANLVRAIHNLNPNIRFYGLGGVKMQDAGVELFFNLADLAVVGFVEVIKNYTKFRKIFFDLLKKADELKPEAVILVDYPGFNMRLAKEFKKRNIKVIYYISPQVWAWGISRIQKIRRYVDKMIVILKFEEELYYNSEVNVTFVGHPLLDVVRPLENKNEFLKKNNLSGQNKIICLLPGSREKEVHYILPMMLGAAKIIHRKIPNSQFILVKSHTLNKEIFAQFLEKYQLPITIIENKTYDCLNSCDAAIVASGTATLETAIMQVPMVIVYKVSFLTWFFIKSVIRIPYIGLVNIVAGRKIVPENIQYDATAEKVATELLNIINSPERISSIKQGLLEVREKLGSAGASGRAAEVILKTIF